MSAPERQVIMYTFRVSVAVLVFCVTSALAPADQQCVLPKEYLEAGPEGYAKYLIGQVAKNGNPESEPAGSHWRLERVELPCNPETWGNPGARVQLEHGSIRIWNVLEWQDDQGKVWRQNQDRNLTFKADRLAYLPVGEKVNVNSTEVTTFSGKDPPQAPDATESHAALAPVDANPVHYFWPTDEGQSGPGTRRWTGTPFGIQPGGPETGWGERLTLLVQLKSSQVAGYQEVRYVYRWVER
jgi:hypothetical protein